MSPTLYLIAAILLIGGKMNNFNIKNHPLDIRVRRDVRTPIHDYAGRVSEELDTRGKLSAILDYERLRQQRVTVGVENNPEETSNISKEELDTNRNLSSDLNGEEINFNSANSEESDNIAGVEESNTNENLSSDHGDPGGRLSNVNPEEFSDIVDNGDGGTAVEDATLAPIKEGRKVKKYGEENTNSSTRGKRDLGNRAIYNQQADGWQKMLTKRTTSNRTGTQYGPNTNKASVPNTETNIMRLYARLPYQKLANTTTYNRIRPHHNGFYPNSISYNQSQPANRVNPAPYNPNQGRIYENIPYNRSQPIYRQYFAPYDPNQGRVYRYNSTNNGSSQTSYGPYNGILSNSNFSGNGLNRMGHGPYNQSQLIYRTHPVPYNPDQRSLHNSIFSGNGLNRTGHGPYNQSRQSYNVDPLPYSPHQGGYYNSLASNLVNGYKSNSPLYDNSAAYAPTYTTGYYLPPPPPSTTTTTTTTTENTTPLIVESCILCVSNGCPSFFRKIGFLCVPVKQ